ncbi:3-phosphoshikimate 1-carboxyvinyltransferase [Arcanobacterium bovis]|uniref:3-phosphoshikimate 1-carboxyvinyltransferase n=1 Tax=Arcanobacterium bovis TaxID=2529275 RepID=A0A4Q9V022_9ACTO|nr:3-phosphoshikimate 1-carboxyvinyltransferase [Arcanobacterium bovis]
MDAHVAIPGSKSLTNRYLVLAALSEAPVVIANPLQARDTELMRQALCALGVSIEERVDGETVTWIVTPRPLHGARINCGLAGTVMRFIPPLVALANGESVLDGDPQARLRPMTPIVDALRQLDVPVATASDALPLRIQGAHRRHGGSVRIDASASSQFVSALLLAGARFEGGIDIYHDGGALPSMPHIAMTIDLLRQAGVIVHEAPNHWRVEPGSIQQANVTVEPDLSNAGPFLAAAMVTHGCVHIPFWPVSTTQPGREFVRIFELMGAQCVFHQQNSAACGVLELTGPEKIRGIDMNFHDVGELVPTVAAVACFADSPSALRDIGQLRGHETDRLAALCTEISKLGCEAHIVGDDLVIEPANCHNKVMHAAHLESYADHRMATFAAIVGLRVPGVSVNNIETTSKTLPNFVELWEGMLR